MGMLWFLAISILFNAIDASGVDFLSIFKSRNSHYKGLRHREPVLDNGPSIDVFRASHKVEPHSKQLPPPSSNIDLSGITANVPAGMDAGDSHCTCTCTCDLPICTNSPTEMPTEVFFVYGFVIFFKC